eukprot:TRINITY_DN10917_c0_g2_i1.p1 TRINITY_DN10917_c0_g2~~TRINITY_DN10917_c0_g2_i1.p1  ORF type:complete len:661 (+),score=104.74 TRINITY_DN10917_c0_g2_i1:295-1983(+)
MSLLSLNYLYYNATLYDRPHGMALWHTEFHSFLYVAFQANHTIVRVDLNNELYGVDQYSTDLDFMGGRNTRGYGEGDGTYVNFNGPTGLALRTNTKTQNEDGVVYLYVADTGNHKIRQVGVDVYSAHYMYTWDYFGSGAGTFVDEATCQLSDQNPGSTNLGCCIQCTAVAVVEGDLVIAVDNYMQMMTEAGPYRELFAPNITSLTNVSATFIVGDEEHLYPYNAYQVMIETGDSYPPPFVFGDPYPDWRLKNITVSLYPGGRFSLSIVGRNFHGATHNTPRVYFPTPGVSPPSYIEWSVALVRDRYIILDVLPPVDTFGGNVTHYILRSSANPYDPSVPVSTQLLQLNEDTRQINITSLLPFSVSSYKLNAVNEAGESAPYPGFDGWMVISTIGRKNTVAGSSTSPDVQDGMGPDARFNHGACMTVAHDGTLYLGDSDDGGIRKIDLSGLVSTVVGPTLGSPLDGLLGHATANKVRDIIAVGQGQASYLYWIEDYCVRALNLFSHNVSTIAGDCSTMASDVSLYGGAPSPMKTTLFGGLISIAYEKDTENLIVTDTVLFILC